MSAKSPGERELLQALLSSGLPLEGQVASVLDKLGFEVMGEYEYMRTDPSGALKEHSVDLRARKFMDWATFELLVECKYNHPGCHWFFVPGKMTGHGYAGTASLHEDLCPCRTRNHHLAEAQLWEIDRKTERCVKGVVVLRRDGGGADKNLVAIEHGLSQLRYAVPQLLSRELQYQAYGETADRATPIVLCSLLVTNAPLHVLKKNVTVELVHNAGDLGRIAKDYPFVRVAQSLGPDLESYAGQFAAITLTSSQVAMRLQDAAAILAGKPTLAPRDWAIRDAITRATEVATVVRLEYFAKLLRWYLARLGVIGKDIVQYATLEPDPAGGASRLRGLNADLLVDDFDEVTTFLNGGTPVKQPEPRDAGESGTVTTTVRLRTSRLQTTTGSCWS